MNKLVVLAVLSFVVLCSGEDGVKWQYTCQSNNCSGKVATSYDLKIGSCNPLTGKIDPCSSTSSTLSFKYGLAKNNNEYLYTFYYDDNCKNGTTVTIPCNKCQLNHDGNSGSEQFLCSFASFVLPSIFGFFVAAFVSIF